MAAESSRDYARIDHLAEEFAERRMDEGIKRALAGRKIGSL